MEVTVMTPMKVKLDAVRVTCRVRYDEEMEGIPARLVDGDRLEITIGLDTGVVQDWPAGERADIHVKVVDEGCYELLSGPDVFAVAEDCYVPDWMPGDHYGDYLILKVDEGGLVDGWEPSPEEIEATLRDEGP